MEKQFQMTFYKAEFLQYNRILEDKDIKNKVSDFLLTYVSLEAFYKKMLIAMKESKGNKLSKQDKKHLSVTVSDVNGVLDYFELDRDEQLVERIFGSNDRNYMECSIKKLRDRLVHNVNDNVIRIVLERYEKMMDDMSAFSAILR